MSLVEANAFRFVNPSIFPSPSDSASASIFNITAGIDGSNSSIRFALETNDDLISQGARIDHFNANEQSIDKRQASPGLYLTKGSVWTQDEASEEWQSAGWARLAVSESEGGVSFDGTFTLFSSQYEIQLEADNDGSPNIMAHNRQSDFPNNNHTSSSICATRLETSLDKRQNGWNAWGDNLEANIGNTYGCPNTRRIANIGIMTDCTYTASFNSSESARRYILNMVNTASVVFENSFNISLSIQNLTLSDDECPTTTSELTAWNTPCSNGDLNSRLQDFSSWRSSLNDNNAYWTLLSGCSVSTGEVGVSWVGALCNSGSRSRYSGGASANVVSRTQLEWQVFA